MPWRRADGRCPPVMLTALGELELTNAFGLRRFRQSKALYSFDRKQRQLAKTEGLRSAQTGLLP